MNVIKQMWINLFGSLWLKEYWFGDWEKFRDRQLDAVKALDDPKKLKRATLEAPEETVRIAAIKKIDDPEVLIALALKDENEEVRRAAEERLSTL